MKQKILLAVIATVTAILITIALINRAPKINCNNQNFAPYISAYTEGAIGKTQSIKVILNSSIADSINRNIAASKLMSIYPKVNGQCKFTDERTIEFIPDTKLASGKKYVVEFELGKLVKVSKELKNFVFPIQVIPQDIKILIEAQNTTDRQTLKYQQIIGQVKTSDIEDFERVKQSVKASINGKSIDINWRNADMGTSFAFSIDNIERTDKQGKLVIKYNGSPINADTKGEKVVEIPAINDFKVSSIKLYDSPSQHIKIQFTDPINETQNLNGLVSVTDKFSGNMASSEYKIEANDNCIRIYPPSSRKGEAQIFVSAGLQNSIGNKLGEDKTFSIDLETQKPMVRSVKTGLILPDGDNGLVYPFEAVNLTAVDVTIIKVLEKNILSYIRDYSDYWNSTNLHQTGVPVFRKTIHIADPESDEVSTWNRYYLELSKLVKTEPGSIYNIKISFRKSHAIFDCDTCNGGDDVSMEHDADISDFSDPDENYDELQNTYRYSAGWNWQNSENPCYKMYYSNDKFLTQNILASNIGLIAKKGNDNSVVMYVTDLKKASPIAGATVELYGYQQQLLDSKNTDQDGKINFGAQPKAYFAIARSNNECNYLKLNDGASLSMSKFDISGNEVKDGIKGFLYAERGVWRPGDSIHLGFILKEDLKNPLPSDYPITVEVRNPLQQQILKQTTTKNTNNFYVFNFKTDNNATTGNYEATVTCGNSKFHKKLRVENVLPNRLKIDTKFNDTTLYAQGNTCNISGAWLHGAIAKNLKVDVQMAVHNASLSFPQWKGYCFDDEKNSVHLDGEYQEIFSGRLDEKGHVSFAPKFQHDISYYPPKMKAYFMTRIYEKSGRFSKDETSIDVMPYPCYVGIKLPETDGHFLYADTKYQIPIVVTDPHGKALQGNRNVRIKLYKLEWQWWYDSNNYVSDYNSTLITDTTNVAVNGQLSTSIFIAYPNWGRFMLDVTDVNTGVKATKIFYVDWPSSFGRSPVMSQGSTIVELSSDKQNYTIGDIANITIPSSEGGYALISIENGTKVLSNQWIKTNAGKTEFKLKILPDMEPGVYVFVTLLQPHAQTANDLPIRMYGVLPLNVENPETILEPQIYMADELQAEHDVEITVGERNNKAMTYTIAVVDDGLLDLTHFKTPDPWKTFYSREALGVSTIDMYDNVIGAFGGRIERMFSIGGDDGLPPSKSPRANNFESVVAFLGPFTTNGGKMHHTIKLPKYIGSVRTMVVAGNGKAYGKAEKTSTVTKPLMIFATTPRVIGTNEKFKLPVTVFTGNDNIKKVTLKIKASGGLSINGDQTITLNFDGKGEQAPSFEITTGNDTGTGTIEVSALSGNYTSNTTISLDIREPNTPALQTICKSIDAGQTIEIPFVPIGRSGTNYAKINIGAIIPASIESRIAELTAYPYESLEQTVSKALPMIYAPIITDAKASDKENGEHIIRESIKKIYAYQTASGGLSYWRGDNYSNVWATNLAGQFVAEAQKAGYTVNTDFMLKWKKYQKLKSEAWTPERRSSYEEQAYRLYTLALAGEELTAQMNRLKEQPGITDEAKIYLASAYAICGKKSIGNTIIANLKNTANENSPSKLTALCDLDQKEAAFAVAKTIAAQLADKNNWMCNQEICMSIVALGKYFDKYKPAANIKCQYTYNDESFNIDSPKAFVSQQLKVKNTDRQTISITNKTNGNLYVEIFNTGIPDAGNEKASHATITAELKFYVGTSEISPKQLAQGTDFVAEVTINNLSDEYLDKMAMTQMFPSGWEISSTLIETDYYNEDYDYDYYSYYSKKGTIKHTDTRDDRKLTYFTLPAHGSITIKTQLTATYAGTYYLPGLDCRDLENAKIFATTKGTTVVVTEDK